MDYDDYVSRLSPDDAREQLRLAYMQMERCSEVLRGRDVQPVEGGLCQISLELFYQCKKVAYEKAYAEMIMRGARGPVSRSIDRGFCILFINE